ncbi:hypothetical protein GOQ27_03430 [Clostridium sp. D2Q-11]|uniref:Uncharacterized protein n=1 Tax=Anaeromonas frigoriresistens TaxID=2683708 RepID=A0A942UZV4_9FIRM|nr:hypothetical protein [Anaeromonas frigoriresistens]MBS4537497.1 hypothetical protein [Anaeromonas frigoriresistens]
MKKIRAICIVLMIFVVIIIIMYNEVMFQEENPLKLGFAIAKLNLTKEEIVKFDDYPVKRYVVKFNDDRSKYDVSNKSCDIFIEQKESQGWKFIELMGSGLMFERDGVKRTAGIRMVTRMYMVILDFTEE